MRRVRFLVLVLAILSAFSLVIFRFWQLQVIEHRFWDALGLRQHYVAVQEPFRRGSFYATSARDKKPLRLVYNLLRYHVFVDPQSIPPECHAPFLEGLSDAVEGVDLPFCANELGKKSRSRRLCAFITPEQKKRVREFWSVFAKTHHISKNALFFSSDYQRFYPFGSLLGQVLHTTQKYRDELTKASFPTGGLELAFHEILEGSVGIKQRMRSPKNQFATSVQVKQVVHGADIHLTIDPYLQQMCEEELGKSVERTYAKGGHAIMMDPSTGKILAMAQVPRFDLNYYQDHFTSPENIENTKFRGVQDSLEPGSIFKPFVLVLSLMANEELVAKGCDPLFDPQEKVWCAQSRFPGRRKPLVDTHLHRYLNMDMALQKSSNVYMAHLMLAMSQRMSDEWIRDKLIDTFGFGTRTGIELPAESAGRVPRPFHVHPNGKLEWSRATPYSLGMGHNIMTTGIQMVRAFAVLANGGYFVEPTLIESIEGHPRRVPHARRVCCEEIISRVVHSLKFSTKYGGTCRKADVYGYTEAGKSATAKKVIPGGYSERLYCPSFIGFAPVTNPRFVLLITLDEPRYGFIEGVGLNHHGGSACAPCFQQIAQRALPYLGVPEDDPFGRPYGDPRRDRSRADWMREIDDLKMLYDEWNAH